ncbi:MAG: sulfite exporter TauE/SafE family protein, partial [Deltaproteobacteria bacterium]
GFNKGVGGGGYGPVVTVGGILSGVPVKSMLAVTAVSEGTVCVFSIIV